MYVEISPRRTGKTERLLKKAASVSSQAVIVCCTHELKKVMKERVYNNEKFRFITWKEYLNGIWQNEAPKFFFDEFDFYGSRHEGEGYRLRKEEIEKFVRNDGYYVTTPSSIRSIKALNVNSLLGKLLYEIAGEKPVHTFPKIVGSANIKPESYPPDIYKIEILGQYLM